MNIKNASDFFAFVSGSRLEGIGGAASTLKVAVLFGFSGFTNSSNYRFNRACYFHVLLDFEFFRNNELSK